MVVLGVVATLPLGVLLSAVWGRSLRRRSRFELRLLAVVACMAIPWLVAWFAPISEQLVGVLLWSGLAWALLLAVLAPLLLFHRPDLGPGEAEGDWPGPGRGPDDDPRPPDRPTGGIPLRGTHRPHARRRRPPFPRRVSHPRDPGRDPERRPIRVRPLWPWPSHPQRASYG
jgi:hypothetical protein